MDFASPQKVMNQNGQLAQYGDDTSLFVEFYSEPVHQVFKSQQENRAIYENRDFISIQAAGQNKTKMVREVREEDKYRFPRQWAAYQAQGDQHAVGMPLTEWGSLTKAQVLEFKAMNIHTVEQLAGLPDSSLGWMGAREIRDSAKKYILTFDKKAVEDLQKQVAELKAALEEKGITEIKPEEVKRKPGRPATQKEVE